MNFKTNLFSFKLLPAHLPDLLIFYSTSVMNRDPEINKILENHGSNTFN